MDVLLEGGAQNSDIADSVIQGRLLSERLGDDSVRESRAVALRLAGKLSEDSFRAAVESIGSEVSLCPGRRLMLRVIRCWVCVRNGARHECACYILLVPHRQHGGWLRGTC